MDASLEKLPEPASSVACEFPELRFRFARILPVAEAIEARIAIHVI